MIVVLPDDVRESLRSSVAITSVSQCVEELVLNSLDAGSQRVYVRVDLDLLRVQVVDDGSGIDASDLHLIGQRYTTSKCKSMADLKRLMSHGYRGEALASIITVSDYVEIHTRKDTETLLKTVSVDKSDLETCDERRPSLGTTVTVFSLFKRLPVRRKSVEPHLERERIVNLLQSLSLSYYRVTFSYRDDVNRMIVYQSRKHTSTANAFKTLFGQQMEGELHEIRVQKDNVEVVCHFCESTRSDKSLQFVFLNDRRILTSIIHESMNEFLSTLSRLKKEIVSRPRRVHPIFIVNVRCLRSDVDVSFDQTKTFVEFHDWKTVAACLRKAVDRFVASTGLGEASTGLGEASNGLGEASNGLGEPSTGLEEPSSELEHDDKSKSTEPSLVPSSEPKEIRLDELPDALFSKPALRRRVLPDNSEESVDNIPIGESAGAVEARDDPSSEKTLSGVEAPDTSVPQVNSQDILERAN